jgi:hypothetical protein
VLPSPRPTTAPTQSPTAVPNSIPTLAPTHSPTVAPTRQPTFIPSSSPTVRLGPSLQPVEADTPVTVDARSAPPLSAPTSRPSRAPTRTPTIRPTSEPTATPFTPPTTGPAEIPHTLTPVSVRSFPPVSSPTSVPDAASPTATATPIFSPNPTPNRDPSGPSTESSCETAFVYCPGYSTCFLDDDFNSGRDIVASDSDESWGWNIECGAPRHCEIWMGAQDCSFQKGRKVGKFYFDEHVATYYLFTGYQSNEFNLYAGQCEGNDGGEFVTNGRWCLPSNVAENARVSETYPLVTNGAFDPVSQFSFSSSNEATYLNDQVWGENNYDVFPVGRNGRQWLTASLEVCTAPH